MQRHVRRWHAGILLATSLALGGCFLVAAGPGAAGAIAYTNRGAKSVVDGTVDQVFARSTAAFGALSIVETGRSTAGSGTTRTLVGQQGDLEVTVEAAQASATTTNVEVYAKRNAVDYDKDFAKDVMNRIIQGG
jgi:hypothetical protein